MDEKRRVLSFVTVCLGGLLIMWALMEFYNFIGRHRRARPVAAFREFAEVPPADGEAARDRTNTPVATNVPSATNASIRLLQPAPLPRKTPARMAVVRGRLADPEYRARRTLQSTRQQRAALDAAHGRARRQGQPVRRGSGDARTDLIAIQGGRVLVYAAENANAAISTATTTVRDTAPYYLDGSGVTFGLWDMGAPNYFHRELTGRVTIMDDAGIEDHSTHVAGTLIASGVTPRAKGMAPAATIDSYEWTLDLSEMIQRARASLDETNTLCLSSHSYGHLAGWHYNSPSASWEWYGTWGERESDFFGLYDSTAAAWDQLCHEAPYFLPFKSAGNDRLDDLPGAGTPFEYYNGTNWVSKPFDPATDPRADDADQGGFDTLPDVANAKNIITVGGVYDAVNGVTRDLSRAAMTAFSCWGPTDDGRVKPDIVANGTAVYSCQSRTTSQYGEKSGTSMAAPNAAGSAALLVDYYRDQSGGEYLLSSSLKGLIIHTADDLGNSGPDYTFGWGLMNTEHAVEFLQGHFEFPNAGRLQESVLSTNVPSHSYALMWDGQSPIRVTLCWTDPPAAEQSALDDSTPRLVHDLDLRLVDSLGTTNFPFVLDPTQPTNAATRGDNTLDNVEQVLLSAPPTNGIYTVVVRWGGDKIVAGTQPYSLLVSGFTAPPALRHEPLDNQTATTGAYRVETEIVALDGLNTNALLVFWNTTGPAGGFQSNTLVHTTNDMYVGQIPAQPRGSTVYYYLYARSGVGLESWNPLGVPDQLFSFEVTEPVILNVYGSPEDIGTVSPGYGATVMPKGRTVHALAAKTTPPQNGHRYECIGWTGHADVPPSGSSNAVSFVITRDSVMLWRWDSQYSLAQGYSGVALASTTTWWSAGSPAATITVPREIEDAGTTFFFAEWRVDGTRWAEPDGTGVYRAEGIAMTTARTAVAHYYPGMRDLDDDGLADWWEVFYYGSLEQSWDDDSDGDGYLNLEEYGDRSNPRDIGDVPGGPLIIHTPLDDPQWRPAPWTVTATVTDNFEVASATLKWRRNGLSWRQTPMTVGANTSEYTAVIVAPGIKGDSYEYWIEAVDAAGYTSETGPFRFFVAYPLISIAPSDLDVVMIAGTATNVTIDLKNSGNTSLVWHTSLSGVGFRDDMESGVGEWTHDGPNDLWHLSSRRAYSGSNAWYSGSESVGLYYNSMNASLVTPLIPLADGARLEYAQWIKTERRNNTETWDGAVVEISLDGGLNYELIEPIGGYPYVIVNNPASPIAFDTPCFGGTGGWEHVTFDLSEFAGLGVKIRFRFGTDEFVIDEGWYIDDVRIGPSRTLSQWLTLSLTNGVLAADRATNVVAGIDTDGLPTRTDEALLVGFHSNDPLTPSVFAEVGLHVRSVPIAEIVSAAQTSTHGEGIVSISNRVADADGDRLDVSVRYSLDQGKSWFPAWVTSAGALVGSVGVTTSQPPQVIGVQTWGVSNAVTNAVTVKWATTNGVLPVLYSSNTLVSVRAWDGLFWSRPVTSQPFVVDNEGPTPPLSVTVTSHTVRTWSPRATVAGVWPPSSDATTIGYVCAVTSAVDSVGGIDAFTDQTSGAALAGGDGTDLWFSVRGVDRFGNPGPSVSAGPLYLDTTPPVATGAVVLIMHEPAGNFVFTPAITSRWSGFTDEGVGIAGYYVALTNRSGTSNGLWTADMTAVVGGAEADATNTVYVWARDAFGWVGAAASASVVVLRQNGDFDGDGLLTWEEHVSGTDPTLKSSVLALVGCRPNLVGYRQEVYTNELAFGDEPGQRAGDVVTSRFGVVSGTIISWNSSSGRYYNVYAERAAGAARTLVATNLPATPPLNVYTDRVNEVGRFYRIGVTK